MHRGRVPEKPAFEKVGERLHGDYIHRLIYGREHALMGVERRLWDEGLPSAAVIGEA
jgi:hypothetical protein